MTIASTHLARPALPHGVEIRDVHGPTELRACQALQRRTWGITEDGYVVPVATMAGAQKVGGLVLGAFDLEHGLIGFTFAFLGRLDDRPILYSQLAAVDPVAQNRGIGRALKFEQRRRAREMGLEAVVWAFDPLQVSNAFFNLGVLGATCKSYEVDLYGSRSDALNVGLATDRLIAEWPTRSDPSPVTDAWPDAPDLVETTANGHHVRLATDSHDPSTVNAQRVRIEIPTSLGEAKREANIAHAWQHHVRDAFVRAFNAGFVAVGFSRADPARPRYLLERRA